MMDSSNSDENNSACCAICYEKYSADGMHRFCKDRCLTDMLRSSQGNTIVCSLCQQSYQRDTKHLGKNTAASSVPEKVGCLNGNGTLNRDTLLTISQKVQDLDKDMFFSPSCGSKDTIPLFKRNMSIIKSTNNSFISENCCMKTLFRLSILVLFIHCVIVGLIRIITGFCVFESAQSVEDIHVKIALFQITEGVIDIMITISLLFTNFGRRKCFPVLIFASIVCMAYGSTVSWSIISNDTFVLVSRYYSVVDWIMIVYIIVFGYHLED